MKRLFSHQRNRLPAVLAGCLMGFALTGSSAVRAESIDADGRFGTWALGGLAYSLQPPPESNLSVLNSKVRIGSSLIPQIEPYVNIQPWIGPGSGGGSLTPRGGVTGLSRGLSGGLSGGVLVDVPLGSFVFTPSVGAGTLPTARREGAPTTEFRSQLELGYEFDNKSRFSLGYSRIVNDAAAGDPAAGTNNVFGFYYRLPFGGP
ncbi:hypothetical protein TSH100_29415 [Azospirillum sp. TSH100]|uniref:hypothetical protein n=1 Tax=Azospirillum sp. TSH100 TaxID=652764 RepID=UPI000D615ABD|nr:hypothetical protein [Azospirillum sp. TSH100]PWC80602.1 hypothetical protein TSH100_29415 [Azospirillum sp. TSH100]QCG91851.1 hypothetical protein E6C72_29110 [Azospirillum sp. TSH100]